MRTLLSVMLALTAVSPLFAQADSKVVAMPQKLDAKVLKPDSADAKLHGKASKSLRNEVNKRDVEAWRRSRRKPTGRSFAMNAWPSFALL